MPVLCVGQVRMKKHCLHRPALMESQRFLSSSIRQIRLPSSTLEEACPFQDFEPSISSVGGVVTLLLHADLPHAKHWHFDTLTFIGLIFSIADRGESHQFTTKFGVRKLEVKDGKFLLNGEHVD